MSDKPNLADARRVTEAATEGPWHVEKPENSTVIVYGAPPESAFVAETGVPEYSAASADAEFIAASRTLVPALLAAVDAVLAVHVRVGSWCAVCADPVTQFDTFQMWPCKTVRAITAHLDIEPR